MIAWAFVGPMAGNDSNASMTFMRANAGSSTARTSSVESDNSLDFNATLTSARARRAASARSPATLRCSCVSVGGFKTHSPRSCEQPETHRLLPLLDDR